MSGTRLFLCCSKVKKVEWETAWGQGYQLHTSGHEARTFRQVSCISTYCLSNRVNVTYLPFMLCYPCFIAARQKRIQPPDWVLKDDLGIPGGWGNGGNDGTVSDRGNSTALQCTEESTSQPPVAMVTGQRDPKHQLPVPYRHPEGIR